MLDDKLFKDDELRTAHFTEMSTDEEIKDAMTDLSMQSLGTMYYDVKSTKTMYDAKNTQGVLLQLVNHDEQGNPTVDENGFLFSGKYDMYDESGASVGDAKLSDVIVKITELRDAVKVFVAENERNAMLANRRLPNNDNVITATDVQEKEM